MQPHNFVNVNPVLVLCRICSLDRQKSRRLSHRINYHSNGVMLYVSMRLPCDEIHIDHVPLLCRNVDLLSHTPWFLMFYLDLLATGHL